ncbi:MAG: DNA double-strand break repair nuclease NurA [Nitrososphaerota archaeon]
MAEYYEWHLLPHDLQVAFFNEAEKESKLMVERIGEVSKLLEEAANFIHPHLCGLKPSTNVYRVAAVDGSRSPTLSERLGVRYGVFTVGAVSVRGLERLDEVLRAGVFKRRQALSRDVSKHLFDTITALAERKVALEILEKNDLVVIDGSFLGFLYHSLRIRQDDLSEHVKKVVNDTFDLTRRLIESGRAIAVIKRSPSRAIGGYMVLRGGRESTYALMLDKFLLSFIMTPGTMFYYDDFLGETHPISYYNAVASLAQKYTSIKEIESRAARDIYAPFDKFGVEKETVRKLSRVQVRYSMGAPACEIEFPKSMPRSMLEEWLGQPNFFNTGTGLPVALDLVDSLVNIPSRFTDEFVAEVEARTLVRLNGRDAETLKLFFSYLNPQKPL